MKAQSPKKITVVFAKGGAQVEMKLNKDGQVNMLELFSNYLSLFCEPESTKHQNAMSNFQKFEIKLKDQKGQTVCLLTSYHTENGSTYSNETF